MLLILLLNALFSITFPLGKLGLTYARPIFFVSVRMLISGLVLLVYLCLFRRRDLRIKKEHLGLFIQLTLFQVYLCYIPDFWALQYVSTSKWAFFYAVSPFFVAIFSYKYFAEHFSSKKLLGFLLSMTSLFGSLLTTLPSEEPLNALFFLSWPELAMLFSSLSFAYGLIIMRLLITTGGYSVFLVNCVSSIGGGIAMLGTSPFFESWVPSPVTSFFPFFIILILIIILYLIYDLLYTFFLKKYSATLLSIITLVDPLVASLYGWFFLGEIVSTALIISSCIAIIGIYLFYQEEIRRDNGI